MNNSARSQTCAHAYSWQLATTLTIAGGDEPGTKWLRGEQDSLSYLTMEVSSTGFRKNTNQIRTSSRIRNTSTQIFIKRIW